MEVKERTREDLLEAIDLLVDNKAISFVLKNIVLSSYIKKDDLIIEDIQVGYVEADTIKKIEHNLNLEKYTFFLRNSNNFIAASILRKDELDSRNIVELKLKSNKDNLILTIIGIR
jgi:hypothetical protein